MLIFTDISLFVIRSDPVRCTRCSASTKVAFAHGPLVMPDSNQISGPMKTHGFLARPHTNDILYTGWSRGSGLRGKLSKQCQRTLAYIYCGSNFFLQVSFCSLILKARRFELHRTARENHCTRTQGSGWLRGGRADFGLFLHKLSCGCKCNGVKIT